MEITNEVRAQLEEQKKQCIFCKIISGEMEGKLVFEDDVVAAYLDIYPAMKGHTLFMLKEHYPIMPYIPAHEFKHYFGLMPSLTKAVKDSIIATGANVFIANGGVAGQQSGHFLLHIFPREQGDGFFNFWFNKRHEILPSEQVNMLANNLPIMMNNHFGRNPASWHSGKGETMHVPGTVIYEDEKVIVSVPEKGVTKGHIEIYSKEEDRDIENLSQESSSHIFYVASFAATAVFEGLGAHGTNIIAKSGNSDDNEGRLVIHVLPRTAEDGLNDSLLWKPGQPSYDLDQVAGKIKDKTWKISHKETKKEPTPQPIITGTAEEEIQKAIEEAGGSK